MVKIKSSVYYNIFGEMTYFVVFLQIDGNVYTASGVKKNTCHDGGYNILSPNNRFHFSRHYKPQRFILRKTIYKKRWILF